MKTQTVSNSELAHLSISEASRLIAAGETSPVALVEACLERIEHLDEDLRAFITVTADSALAEARLAETAAVNGYLRGPLHGIPIALKDIVDTAGVPTTSGSGIHEGRVPTADACVAERLRNAGSVLMGKLNLSEFAMGGTVHHSFGTPKNPWDRSRNPGSSSSGSAIAVATGMAFGALGSDTGGSIRGPASYCGIVGIRPTYGRVPRHGVTPLSWSLDTVGPMTRNVTDCAIMLQAIAGHDPRDATSSQIPVPAYASILRREPAGLDIGLPVELCEPEILDPEVKAAFDEAVTVLRSLVDTATPVSFPTIDMSPTPVIVISDVDAADHHAPTLRTRASEYDENVRLRLLTGAAMPGDAYVRAQRIRALVRSEMLEALERFEVLAAPATHTAAPPLATTAGTGGSYGDMRGDLPRRVFSGPGSLAGLPTLVLPCGFTAAGLPIGLQLIGRPFEESTLFRLGRAYERATDWHQRQPPV